MPLFRAPEPGDLDAVVELAAATFPFSAPDGSDPDNITAHIAKYLNRDVFQAHLRDPAARLIVAEEAGRLLGYSLLLRQEPQDPEVAALV